MKKQLIRFRWLIYVAIIAFFANLYIKKNLAEEECQKELIAYLELEGIRVEQQPQEWAVKLPRWAQPYFENFVSVSVNYCLEDCVIGDTRKKLNRPLLRLITEFDIIHSLRITADSNNELVEDFFVELFSNVQTPTEVKELDVYSPFLSKRVFNLFAEYTNLESIYIAATSIPNESILSFPINENLHTFFCKNDGRYTEKEFKHVLQSKKLKELGFENYGVDQSDTDLTPYLKDLKDLEFVKITGNYSKFNVDSLPSLRTVGFYGYVINNDNILKALYDSKAQFRGAEIIIGNQVTNEGLRCIPDKWELTITNPSLDLDSVNWEELLRLEKLTLPAGTDIKKVLPHLRKIKNLNSFSCPELVFESELYMELENQGINVYRPYRLERKWPRPLTRSKIQNADKSLTHIFFEVNELTAADVKSLSKFKNLESLKLKCCSGLEKLNALSIERISRLEVEHLDAPGKPLMAISTNLNHLKITSHKKISLEKLIDISSFSQLESLDLSFPKLFKIDLSGSDQLTSLKSLKFSGMCMIESGAFESLEVIHFDILPSSKDFWKDLGSVASLKSANGQFIGVDEEFMNLISAAEKFTELDLRYASIRKNETLEQIKKFKNIRILHLPPEEMTADQAINIFSGLENLKKVYLRIGLSERTLRKEFPEIEFLR